MGRLRGKQRAPIAPVRGDCYVPPFRVDELRKQREHAVDRERYALPKTTASLPPILHPRRRYRDDVTSRGAREREG